MMRFGSVCSGIEAASVAWAPLGWKAAWLSEIEPFPSAVLAHHYPDVPNLGDMTKLAAMIRAGEIEAPDVFCGGTPCQAFSVAGLRKSLDDARGNLSLTFCEIANAIDHVRTAGRQHPAIVFWENVPGVLNTKDNAFGCFLAGLAGEADPLEPPGGKWSNAGAVFGPQRAVAWRVTDAQYFGVAQRRRRVFVVASARDGFDPAAVLFEWDGVRRDSAPSRKQGQDAAGCLASRTDGGGFPGTDEACSGYVQPVVGTLTASFGRLLGQSGQDADHGHSHLVPDTAHTLRGEGFDASEDGTGRGTPLVPVAFDTTQITSKANYSNPQPGDPCHPLAAGAHPPAIAFDSRQDPVSSEHHFGALSSSSPQAQAVAFNMHKSGNEASTLGVSVDRTDCLRAFEKSPFAVQQSPGMQVRRLTPVECERLQGFPDGYTAIPWRKKPASECPDGPRYKALGNSWAVPNVRWIGARIHAHVLALEHANDNSLAASEVAA